MEGKQASQQPNSSEKNTPGFLGRNAPINQECLFVQKKSLAGLKAAFSMDFQKFIGLTADTEN